MPTAISRTDGTRAPGRVLPATRTIESKIWLEEGRRSDTRRLVHMIIPFNAATEDIYDHFSCCVVLIAEPR